MAKVGILDMEIHVYTPMKPGRPCIALIGDCPVIFKAPTPFAVHKAADEWRRAEVAKVKRAEENAAKRVEAARAAREAKREAAE